MSGSYNVLFGEHPAADFLLWLLNVHKENVPRYRDCFINKEGDIIIYTRTGGNNRKYYATENDAMKKIAGYKFDADESVDNTYASFHYAPPEHHQLAIDKLIEIGAAIDQTQRWKDVINSIGKMESNRDRQI